MVQRAQVKKLAQKSVIGLQFSFVELRKDDELPPFQLYKPAPAAYSISMLYPK